jgi:hypothetical protein
MEPQVNMAAGENLQKYVENGVIICSQRYLKVKWELTHDI